MEPPGKSSKGIFNWNDCFNRLSMERSWWARSLEKPIWSSFSTMSWDCMSPCTDALLLRHQALKSSGQGPGSHHHPAIQRGFLDILKTWWLPKAIDWLKKNMFSYSCNVIRWYIICTYICIYIYIYTSFSLHYIYIYRYRYVVNYFWYIYIIYIYTYIIIYSILLVPGVSEPGHQACDRCQTVRNICSEDGRVACLRPGPSQWCGIINH